MSFTLLTYLIPFLARIKQAQMQKELEEAASEVKVINPERSIFESPLLSASIPTKVHSKFVSECANRN